MDKYLGIIKISINSMSGRSTKILSRTSNDLEYLNKWFSLYPNTKHIILENTTELDLMFWEFKDYTSITEEEHKKSEIFKKKVRRLMDED